MFMRGCFKTSLIMEDRRTSCRLGGTVAWEVGGQNRSSGQPKSSLDVSLTNSLMILKATSTWFRL
jgi:hypothetical protein